MAGRRGEYLFKRAGSDCWHVRFVYPPGMRGPDNKKKIEFSLRTMSRVEAEAIAGPHIAEHKRAILLNSIVRGPQRSYLGRRFEPGKMHVLDDGTRVLATADTLTFLDQTGAIVRTEANVESQRIVFDMTPAQRREIRVEAGLPVAPVAPKKPVDDPDDDHIERWIKQGGITPHIAREARLALATFKTLKQGKRFADSLWQDGVDFADHLFAQGQAYATVRKKVSHLRAAVNLAIKTGQHKGANPFSDVVKKKKRGDIKKRPKLSEDDMAIARRLGPGIMSQSEWLLWMLLASTGMRLEEAVTIESEDSEKGIRFAIVGTKTDTSERRVPFPDAVLALLPKRIDGPLFPGEHAAMLSKRMNRRMRKMGIATKENGKVIHSLRHRAKDQLRIAKVEKHYQLEALGHERRTVADGYGNGEPMSVMKPVIEKIGY